MKCYNLTDLRITLDDLGLYPGIERGAVRIASLGVPVYCSWLSNYLIPGTEFLNSHLCMSGLHFNVLEGRSSLGPGILTDKKGFFNRSWQSFLFPGKKTKKAVERELEHQVEKVLSWFGKLTHIDSHLHLHSIPWIYRLLQKHRRKYRIEYIRNPHQKITDDPGIFLDPAALPKILILRVFALINRPEGYPCFGVNYVFKMDHKKIIKLTRNKKREVIWHPALNEEKLDFTEFRYIKPDNPEKRSRELEELRKFILNYPSR